MKTQALVSSRLGKNLVKHLAPTACRFTALPLAISILLFGAAVSRAANGADTWVGNTSANLGDANWTGANNPPLSGDSWVFILAGTSGTTLNNNLTAGNSVAGITFNGGASAFTFTNNSITLTGGVINNSTSLETINFPISSTSAQIFATAAGGGNITLGGAFSGTGGGITKTSLGTLTLNGAAANTYTGPTAISGGSLIEDFANAISPTDLINNSSVLTLGGGTFQVKQKSATTTSQTFASTTVNPGAAAIVGTQVGGSGTLTIALRAITQNVGGTVDFTTNTPTFQITTTTPNVNGILGGWATVGNAISSTTSGDWAANDGSGNITNYTAYTAVTGNQTGAGASAQNWENATGTAALTASATINSLNEQNDFAVNDGITLTLGSGGLMLHGAARWLTPGSNHAPTTSILESGLSTGELYVHVPENDANANNWTIWPVIADGSVPSQFIKDGPGLVKMGNNFNSYTGGTTINGGILGSRDDNTDWGGGYGATGIGTPFGTGNVAVNGGQLRLGTDVGANNFQEFDITNNVSLNNGGILYENDAFQHVQGNLTVGPGGGILGATYDGSNDARLNLFCKGLFIDGFLTGTGNLTLQQSGLDTVNTYDSSTIFFTSMGTAAQNTYSGTVSVIPFAAHGGSYLYLIGTNVLANATINLTGDNSASAGRLGAPGLLFGSGTSANGVGYNTIGGLSGSGSVVLANTLVGQNGTATSSHSIGAAVALTVGNNNANTTYSGAMSGAGSLTKVGTGTMTLSGANTFSGGLTNSAGTLVIGNSSALGAGLLTLNGGAISNNSGGTFAVANSVNLAGSMSVGVNTNDSLTFLGVITNTGAVTKVGNGTLVLNGANTYSGNTIVSGGRLTISAAQISTSPIVVSDGTKLGVTPSGSSHLSPTTLTVGSSTGATLEFTVNSTNQAPLTPGTLILNGINTINVVGGNFVAGNSYPLLTYTTASGGGSLVAGTIPGGVTGTITHTGNTWFLNVATVAGDVWTGTINGTWDINNTQNWLTNGVAGVYLDGSQVQFDDTGLNTTSVTNLPGTVLSPSAIIVTNNAKNYAIKTVIVGAGGIIKNGTGTLTNSGANTYTGPTVINNGSVVAAVTSVANVSGALGVNSAVSLANNATAALVLNNATQIGSLTGGGTTGGNVTNGGALLTVGGDNTSPAPYAGVISGTGGLAKIGTGTLTLSSTNTYTGATTVTGGTLILSGLSNSAGAININPASGTTATLNLSGTITNTGAFNVGTVAGGTGIVNVNSATTFSPGTGTSAIFIGNAGFGTYNQTGGTVTSGQYLVAGITGAGTVGIMNISGGTYSPKAGNNGGTLGATANTTGLLNMTGAGSYVANDTTPNGAAGIYVGENGTGTLNISGSATMTLGGATTSAGLDIGRASATATGIVNLGAVNAGGGTITTMRVGKNNAGATGTLNFHGGVLRAGVGATPVFMTGLTAAYDYSEGAVIDNNGQAITINQPILAPTGSGVTAIANNASGLVTIGYTTAPYVSITGGTVTTAGSGATAVATVDGSGNLTAITISNPGSYSDVTGITVTLSGGGYNTTSSTTAITTAPNVSGGLTSIGSGILTLGGVNTYTGTTLVAGGTLNLDPSIWSPTGPVIVTNAALAVNASSGIALSLGSLTLQNNATNTFSYGTLAANPANPAINCAAISAPGSGIVINVFAFGLQAGSFPLIQYGGSLGSIANFSLGALPPGVTGILSNDVVNSQIDMVVTGTGQNLSWYGLLPDGVSVSSNWDISVTTNWVSFGTTTPALAYKEYTASGSTVGDPVRFDDTLYNNGVNPQPTNINMTTPVRPFQFVVDSTLPYSFSSSTSITNGLTGLGSLVKSNTGSLTLLTSNSYIGGTIVGGGGTLIITNDFALGITNGPVTLSDSTLQVNGSTTNNSRAFTVSGTSSIGVITNTSVRFGGTVSASGGLTKIDNGTLTLAGNDNITGTLTVSQGALNLTGSNNLTGVLTVSQGTLTTAGTNILTQVPVIGNTAGLNGILNIAGGNFRANSNPGQFTSSILIGSAAGSAGDVRFGGGTLVNGTQLGLGNALGGYAAFNMSGGIFTNGSYIVVGFNSDMAVYNQSSGNVIVSSNLMTIAAGGTAAIGVANFSGGTFTSVFPASSGIMVGERGLGTMNVSGSAVITVTNNNGLSIGPNATQTGWNGRLNLNGGTVVVNRLVKGPGTGTALLGLNGGTIKASGANAAFVTGIDKATVYNGGVTVDDSGFAITIPQPLLAAAGSGVASIAVTPSSSSGYIDSPIVTITDNSGLGSNAMATATVSGGQVTGIIITCPGNGFDPVNSSLSVTFTGGGATPTSPTIGAITYSANSGGGLTKKGSGTLTLTGVNTFTGPITNNAGTLSLNSSGTYGGAVINAGTLSMTTASTLTGSTTVSNGATLIISQIGSATNNIGNLTIGVSATATNATLGLGLTGLTPTIPLVNCGTLTLNATNNINVSGSVPLGAIPLIKYAGAIAGSGTLTNLTLPQGVSGFISNSAANSTLYVVITNTGPGLVWTGFNTNAALTNLWDINSTTNWLLGATTTTYQQPIIPGDVVTFNDSGSGTVILNTNVGPSSVIISNNSTSYTFNGNGTISGSTGIQKLGGGTAILNLTNNSYLGDTVISNGTLQVGSASALSPSANLVMGSSGTLQLTNFSQTINGLSGSGLIDNSSATATVLTIGNGNGGGNWSGTITNTGTGGQSLVKVGSGTSIITGTNYLASTAASQINGGALLITNGGALHMSGGAEFWVMQNAGSATVTVDGGTLDVENNWLVVGRNAAGANGTLIVNSGLVNKGGANNIVVGSLGAQGTLIVNGGQVLNTGNLWLGEGATAIATLYLNGGLIQATQVRENNSGGFPTAAGVAYFNGGTLQATASSGDFIDTVVSEVMSNGFVLDDNGNTLTINASPLHNGDGLGGGFLKKGPGTVYLDTVNDYAGATVVTNGTLAGIGQVSGPVMVAPAGNLGAGDASGPGTFTTAGDLVLHGNTTLRVNRTVGFEGNDELLSGGAITYGGILTIANITSDGTLLTNGATFQIFNIGGTGNFTSIVGSPGDGLAYSFDPSSGILSVVTAAPPSAPTGLKFTGNPVLSGTGLTISLTNTGGGTFYLLSSTNVAAPLSTWTPVWTNTAGGSGTLTTNIANAVNPALGRQFYILSTTNQ